MEENIAVQNTPNPASVQEAKPAQGFDELLRERDFQSEFDRRVSRALETARGKWAQETERKIAQARTEAEARARMSGEERMAHDFASRQRELELREQELTRRELHSEAVRLLQERGLPGELAAMMHFTGTEAMQQSVEQAERIFGEAVQQGVERRMRGSAPAAPGHRQNAHMSDDDYYRTRIHAGK